jgi:hypothetical protein
MTIYALMLFVHVTSDIGIFVGVGAWLLGLAALRRAQDVSQVRRWPRSFTAPSRFQPSARS